MRILTSLTDPYFRRYMAIFEVDDYYIGGKNNNSHADKKMVGSGAANKFPVMGAVSRKRLLAYTVSSVNHDICLNFVCQALSEKVVLSV